MSSVPYIGDAIGKGGQGGGEGAGGGGGFVKTLAVAEKAIGALATGASKVCGVATTTIRVGNRRFGAACRSSRASKRR